MKRTTKATEKYTSCVMAVTLCASIAHIVPRTEMVDLSQYLPGFAELLDLDDG